MKYKNIGIDAYKQFPFLRYKFYLKKKKKQEEEAKKQNAKS